MITTGRMNGRGAGHLAVQPTPWRMLVSRRSLRLSSWQVVGRMPARSRVGPPTSCRVRLPGPARPVSKSADLSVPKPSLASPDIWCVVGRDVSDVLVTEDRPRSISVVGPSMSAVGSGETCTTQTDEQIRARDIHHAVPADAAERVEDGRLALLRARRRHRDRVPPACPTRSAAWLQPGRLRSSVRRTHECTGSSIAGRCRWTPDHVNWSPRSVTPPACPSASGHANLPVGGHVLPC